MKIEKGTNKSFFCHKCRNTTFNIGSIKTYKGIVYLFLKCKQCNESNSIPVNHIKELFEDDGSRFLLDQIVGEISQG